MGALLSSAVKMSMPRRVLQMCCWPSAYHCRDPSSHPVRRHKHSKLLLPIWTTSAMPPTESLTVFQDGDTVGLAQRSKHTACLSPPPGLFLADLLVSRTRQSNWYTSSELVRHAHEKAVASKTQPPNHEYLGHPCSPRNSHTTRN